MSAQASNIAPSSRPTARSRADRGRTTVAASVVLFGPDKRRLLVRLEHVAGRRAFDVLEAAQRLMDRWLRVLNAPLLVDHEPRDGVFDQIQIAVRVHRRHANPDECAALR